MNDDSTWERYGLAAGILFVVLVVIAALIGGAPPKPTDSAAKVASYFRDNQDALKVGSYLNGLAAVAFLLFLGSLWTRLRRVEGPVGRLSVVALSGGIAALGLAVIADAINSYIALYAGELGASGAQAFYVLAVIVLSFAAFALAVFVAATSVMILRRQFVERWLGWIGLAIAGLWLIAGIGVADNDTPIHTVGFVAFLLWAGWLLVLAVLLLTRELPADAPTQA